MGKKLINNNLNNAVINGVKKTYEEMAFIDVIEVTNKSINKNFKHILYIDILEPIFGKIALYLSYECKKMISENIYSKEMKDLHIDEIDDCQLELLNVLVGNILLFYCKKEKNYKLDLPKILFDEKDIKWDKKKVKEYYFDAEGCNFKLLVELKE